MHSFLIDLVTKGQVQIAGLIHPSASDLTECEPLVRLHAADAAADVAGPPPVLSMQAALWAARLIHRSAQFLVIRTADAAAIEAELSEPCPAPTGASACFSADLYLRYLPDLVRLSRGISEDDPLVRALLRLCRQWPLSSVGVSGLGEVDVSAFIEHAGLRQLYIDRVIEHGDAARLDHPRVVQALAATVGMHPQLGGRLTPATTTSESMP